MSWRAESTFKPTSALHDEEKEWLKLAKKFREILKLEERVAKGEALEGLQQEKVSARDKTLKELIALGKKLPGETQVLEKNPDIAVLMPGSIKDGVEKKKKQDQQVREKREQEEIKKKDTHEFMSRHDKPIVDCALAVDGRHIFTCSKDYYALLWSLKGEWLQAVATYGGHRGAVFALDATSGPRGLATGGADGVVHFWEADPGRMRPGSVMAPSATLEHGGIVRVLRWCPFDDGTTGPQRLASASEKLVSKPPSICVWKVGVKGKIENVARIDDPKVLPGKANDLRWGSGGKTKLFSCHDNGYVGVWGADAGELLKTLKLHTGPVMSLSLSSDGSTLVTASHDQSCSVVDVSTPATPTVLTIKANRPLNALCLSEDFKAGEGGSGFVALAGGKNSRDVTTQKTLEDEFESKIMDAVNGEEAVSSYRTHFGPVHRLLALPEHKSGSYVSVSEDGCVKIHAWDGTLLQSDVKGDVQD